MPEPTVLTLSTDGAAPNNQHENKREAAVGYVVQKGSETLIKNGEYLGQGPEYTNNVAEYQAVKLGAEKIVDSWDPKTIKLEIQTDSQLVVNQLLDNWNRDDDKTQRNYRETIEVLSKFAGWNATQMSETKDNVMSVADDIANEALDT